MQENNSPLVISVDKNFNGNKKRNFFITIFLQGFLWMLFHFTVVFFFTFKLESVVLVWVFLWLWNFVSFLIDIPIGILQKYLKSKTLYLIGAISQFIAMLIFVLFIFQITDQIAELKTMNNVVDSILSFFLGSILNIVLLLIASICYGITQELNSVTSLSYVMNNVEPSKYAEVLARSNIFSWLWMFAGLMFSWVIMSFSPKSIIFALILIIALVLYFMSKFFDNSDESIQISDIKNLKVSFNKMSLENVKEYISENIKKEDLKEIVSKSKYIFLKPKEIKGKIDIKKVMEETKSTFNVVVAILKKKPLNITIYWTIITVLTFGFWDTFSTTFLINFLDKVKPWWSYFFLWLIAIPAYLLQEFFWNMGKKFWTLTIAFIWLLLSGISLILMGIFSKSWAFMIMTFAIMNSIGYAAWMALGQISFLDAYNKEYAKYMNLKEIDANASAWPMKILQNFANVVGLMLWGFILWVLQYTWFFILFGMLIIRIFIWSIKNKKGINL